MLLGTSASPGVIYGPWVCPCVFVQCRQLTHSTSRPSSQCGPARRRVTAPEDAVLTTVLQGQQRVVCRQWFRGRHIQSSSGNLATGQGLVQVVLVHHVSPGTQWLCECPTVPCTEAAITAEPPVE